MADTTRIVNTLSTAAENPRAVVGHNRPSLSEAALANLQTGVLLLCKEALITAIQDRRLQRPHLRVLATIAEHINTRTAKAWPSRMAIALKADLSPKSVSNVVLELRGWGYLVADRETVEEADGKRLTVYTFGNIDHEGIRREITAFVKKLREQRDPEPESSRQGGNYHVPPWKDVPAPDGTTEFPPQLDVPATTGTPQFPSQQERPVGTGIDSSRQDGEFPPGRERSSRQGGDSNLYKEQEDLSLSADALARAPDWTLEDGCFAGQVFELDEIEYANLQRAYGNLEFPAELVTADAYLAGEFAKETPSPTPDQRRVRLRLYLNNQNRKAGELRRQVMATAASKPRKAADPMIGENADRSSCWIDETGLHLVGEYRAEWLEKFDGNEERLNMAVKEIAPHVKPNSPTSLKVQVDGKLGKIIGEKIDKDTRYAKASKPEKGISRLKEKFLRAGE